MKTFLTLDLLGIAAALFFGLAILLLGGAEGIFFLLIILLFLASSAMVTEFRREKKQALGLYEMARGWKNVIANGSVPLLAVLLYFVDLNYYQFVPSGFLIIAYVASVAAVAADKFSSEIGVFDSHTVMITTLKRTKPGTSGGISLLGLGAGVLGSAIIGSVLYSFPSFRFVLVLVVACAMFGNLVDSFFGYFEGKGIGNKYTSNLLCAASSFLLCLLLLNLV